MIKTLLKFFIIALVPLIITGCGISDNYKKSAEKVISSIDQTVVKLENERKSFVENELYKKYKTYADREKLVEQLDSAVKNKSILLGYKTSIEGYIKLDKSKDEPLLATDIRNARTLIDKLENSVLEIKQRLVMYQNFEKNRDSFVKYVLEESSKIKSVKNSLESHISRLSKDFPNKESEIKARTNPALDQANALIKDFDPINNEKDMIKFLSILDKAKAITTKTISNIQNKELEITELEKSKVKILKDSRADYYVVGTIYSWDEYSDWDTEATLNFPPKKINEDMVDLIDSKNVEQIAKYPAFFSSYDCKTDERICALFASEMKSKKMAGRGDTDAELWLNDITAKYYFQYVTVINDKEDKAEWVEVSESEYNKYVGYEGHEVYSKPYGYFADEALNQPNPVGMSLVGNPKYGEWKTNEQGESFWSFYGKYRMFTDIIGMFAGNDHRYYRNDYNHWNSNYRNKKYTGKEDRYSYGGTTGYTSRGYSYTSKRTSSSKTGVKTGTSTRSIKGIGSATRGRGAAGGGK